MLESNPSAFSLGGRLKSLSNSPSNPSSNPNDGNRLLLLLFPEGRLLLLLFSPKSSNPSNGFASIMPKCGKYSPSVFLMLAVFCC